NYAIMGMCHDGTADNYADKKICGNFYSIFEASDGAGSCKTLLENKECTKGFEELELHMGNGHGFLYQPYHQWVQPLLQWIYKAGK
ncbi:MAG: hypothetical protein KDC07_04055, partial [Chitinophagaceae bacterium]|nr:hypothetical protein [Chitinophagaceae bacterium]